MEDLINSMSQMQIKEFIPYHKVIPEQVLNMIYNDIEYMFKQIVYEHLQSVPVTFELFKNIYTFKKEELKIIYDYVSKCGYNILEHRFKNSGLYYNRLDLETYIDYYCEEIREHISLSEGC